MSNRLLRLFSLGSLSLVLLFSLSANSALAQSTAFTYQGKLADSGNPANGNYDFQFKLFDTQAVGSGTQQGTTVNVLNVAVSGGIFTVQLDFGACATCFNGAARYLEIALKPTSGSTFTTLGPRQAVSPSPYAIRSLNATTADNALQLNGRSSSGFILNGTTQQAGTSFNVSGDGTAGGMLTGSIINAATQYNVNGTRAFTINGAFFDGTAGTNTFTGEGAGLNTIPDPELQSIGGKFNSFYGLDAGKANTDGYWNAFFGNNAGRSNTIGYKNTFFGVFAGMSSATATDNAFFGMYAGQNTTGGWNSFFGSEACRNNTTGTSNTCIGNSAGHNLSDGYANTLIGVGADSGAVGSLNTALGTASSINTNLIFATAVGAYAKVTQSNSLVLGSINGVNGANADTSVGIGTTAPAARLHVVDPGSAGLRVQTNSAGGAVASFGGNGDFQIDATNVAGGRLIVKEAGNVGVGTTAPAARLHVVGNWNGQHGALTLAGDKPTIRFSGGTVAGNQQWMLHLGSDGPGSLEFFNGGTLGAWGAVLTMTPAGAVGIGTSTPADTLQVVGNLRVGFGTNGCIKDADGTVIAGTCSSDVRLKRDILPFAHLLDRVAQLQPVTFYWRAEEFKDRHFGSRQSYGLIAQEVEKVLPELVSEDEQGYKAVNYSKLPLLTLQAVRELKAENDALKEQIQEQQVQADRQQRRLQQHQQQLTEQQQQMAAMKQALCQLQPQADFCKVKPAK